MIGNTSLTIIDKNIYKRNVYLFEFTLSYSDSQAQCLEELYSFIESYSPLVKINANLLILFQIKSEKAILKDLDLKSNILNIESYSLICIEKGYIASSWLKKL